MSRYADRDGNNIFIGLSDQISNVSFEISNYLYRYYRITALVNIRRDSTSWIMRIHNNGVTFKEISFRGNKRIIDILHKIKREIDIDSALMI